MENKIITVTGRGVKSFKPDQITIRLTYEKVLPTYEEALAKAAEYTKIIKIEAVEAGVEKTKVLTESFDVSPKDEQYKDKDGEYHWRFVGFKATVGFALKIPMDNKLLSNVLYALRTHEGKFRISYNMVDNSKAKEEAMEAAVEDALRQAKILTKAAGETLGEIVSINHSYGRIEIEHSYNDGMLLECQSIKSFSSAPEIDINPDDIDVGDTVNITWSLK